MEDAERYKVEDQEYKKKVDTYNVLENYIYGIKNKIKNGNFRSRISSNDLKKMDDMVAEAMKWLDVNKGAEMNVTADKKKELESMCNSIIGQLM